MGADSLVPRELYSGNNMSTFSLGCAGIMGTHNWDISLFLFMLIVQFSTDPISNCIKTEHICVLIFTHDFRIFLEKLFQYRSC